MSSYKVEVSWVIGIGAAAFVDYLRRRAAEHGPSDLSSAASRPIFLDVPRRPFETVAVRLLAALAAALALAGAAAAQTRSDPVLQKRLARALVVPHVRPSQTGALAFRDTLRAAGIAVAGRPAPGRADAEAFPLVSVTSPTLATIVRTMDLESDNFTAELLLKELGAIGADRGTTAAGAAVVTRELGAAGVPLAGVRIVDGSGLSPLDRLTPNALVGILEAAWATPQVRNRFLAALPVAGVSGTLHDRMRRAPARGTSFGRSSAPSSKRRPSSRSSATSWRFASSENHSAIASARSGPMPSTSWICSWLASTSRSALSKWRARFCAVTQPTSGMLSPSSTRENGTAFDAWIDLIAFVAEISA